MASDPIPWVSRFPPVRVGLIPIQQEVSSGVGSGAEGVLA